MMTSSSFGGEGDDLRSGAPAARAVWRRCREMWRGGVGASSAWEALGDLLEEPCVAVGIGERCERAVAGTTRVGAGHLSGGAAVMEEPAGVVEDLADVDPSGEE